MSIQLLVVILIILGLALGFLTSFVFQRLPEKWLQDYDYDSSAPDFRIAKRMKLIPHGLISGLACVFIYLLAILILPSLEYVRYFHLILLVAVTPVFIMVLFADKLNRIIPDQFSVYIAFIGVLSIIADYSEGSLWVSSNASWYVNILNHVLGGLIGGGLLLLIDFLCETFLGKMGMGMGDVKLLFATGFVVGGYGLVFTFYIAVFTGVIFAIPMIIRKYLRIAKENKEIKNSKNPSKTRREIQLRKKNLHYADDPDYLAFGPFIAIGGALFMALEPLILNRFIGIFEAFNLIF